MNYLTNVPLSSVVGMLNSPPPPPLAHVVLPITLKYGYFFIPVFYSYRVSPWQKAEVVRLTRTFTNDITLAIGDGANDVGMIQVSEEQDYHLFKLLLTPPPHLCKRTQFFSHPFFIIITHFEIKPRLF